jgi:hypothetical protein
MLSAGTWVMSARTILERCLAKCRPMAEVAAPASMSLNQGLTCAPSWRDDMGNVADQMFAANRIAHLQHATDPADYSWVMLARDLDRIPLGAAAPVMQVGWLLLSERYSNGRRQRSNPDPSRRAR